MSESQSDVNRMNVEHLALLIHDLGYKAKIMDDGQPFIASATSGLKFIIAPYDGGSMQFSLSISNDIGFSLENVNEFNREQRFVKLYLGIVAGGNEIVLEADFTGPPDRPEDWLGASFNRWETAVDICKATLDRVSKQKPDGQSDSAAAA